jgi:hypothetical protein
MRTPHDPRFDWSDFRQLSELPDVDEAIRNAMADKTEDNVICMVRAIVEAAGDRLGEILATQQTDQVELSQAGRDVLAERQRQINVEGWTQEHDDEYSKGEMAAAAAAYADPRVTPRKTGAGCYIPMSWPWAPGWWKPKDKRNNLVKAGALILAEIERLDRADATVEGML